MAFKTKVKSVITESKIFLLIFISNSVCSNEVQKVDLIYNGEERQYLIYSPISNKESPNKIVIGLHGYTGSASGFEIETTGGFNLMADKYNFIAVYPQGSYFFEKSLFRGEITSNYISSWNDLTGSKTKTPNGETCAVDAVVYAKYENCIGTNAGRCAWTSCGDDIGFIKDIILSVKDKFDIDDIYVVGMSNGGKMAHALGCEYPDLIKGVINVVGSPQYGLACKPKGPVNYIIYAGFKDDVVPPFDVVSFDKYFYTPLTDIVNNWKTSFNCTNLESNTINTHNLIQEKIHTGCDDDVKIISLLNMDKGHSWPGSEDNAGFCRSNLQSEIDIQLCESKSNLWGNEFLLERLFK